MPDPATFDSNDSNLLVRRSALRLTLIYLVLGLVWILLTDWIVASVVSDPQRLTLIQSLKGSAYVALSAVAIFVLAYQGFRAFAQRSAFDRNLRIVLDTIPTRVAWKESDGQYRGGNRRFLEDAGISAESELRGQTDAELPWADEAEEIVREDRAVMESGQPVLDRKETRTGRDGGVRWLRVSRVPLENADGSNGVLICYEDETERTLAESRLRHAQRMHEIGQLTSGVAHDFRNVLSVILANADLLAGDGLEADAAQESVRDIRKAAKNARGSVEKLLGFARRADLSLAPIQVGPVVRALQPMLSRMLMSEFPVSVMVEDDLPSIRADPDALDQMLLNLVTNARDAMEPGEGEIRISVRSAHVGSSRPGASSDRAAGAPTHPGEGEGPDPIPAGRYVVLEVSDDGEGIGPEILDRVFDPFFTTKARGVGTGLGLSMVQGLMQQHNGGVRIRSHPGGGTTVELYFPVPPESGFVEESAADASMARSVGVRAGTVLVVDDQAALRRTIARALQISGYEVRLAGDGSEALEIVRSDPGGIDLILSDLTMPGLSGLELFRALRAEDIEIPFALTTGRVTMLDEASSEEERSLPILEKPWTIDQLTAVVDRLVR